MQIQIKATNLDLTPAIKEYTEKKISLLDRFLQKELTPVEKNKKIPASSHRELKDRVIFIEIARTTRHHRHGNIFYAEATLELDKETLRAEHSDYDIRVAIDKVRDKFKKEIIKHKEKKHHRNTIKI